ncbi:MAG: DegV family protein [Erysipelotrichaceae bacterium]|nr:DegV family protein [Erysipelotrichaceae bacterium]
MEWGLVLDSSGDILESELKEDWLDVTVISLVLTADGTDYIDDENLDCRQFSKMLLESKTSSTACPSPAVFAQEYKKSKNVICITVTGGLSGTYNSAVLGAQMAKEDCPDLNVYVINSRGTGGSIALIALYAKELMRKGLSFEEVCKQAQEYSDGNHLVFTLGDYGALIQTGRMKPLVGTVISALNIRVFATNSPEGTIIVRDKARGVTKIYRAMVEFMLKEKNLDGKPVYISHVNNPEGADTIVRMLKEKCSCLEPMVHECRGLCTYYAREGGIIIAY